MKIQMRESECGNTMTGALTADGNAEACVYFAESVCVCSSAWQCSGACVCVCVWQWQCNSVYGSAASCASHAHAMHHACASRAPACASHAPASANRIAAAPAAACVMQLPVTCVMHMPVAFVHYACGSMCMHTPCCMAAPVQRRWHQGSASVAPAVVPAASQLRQRLR